MVQVPFLTYIQKVPGSNLCWDTNYPKIARRFTQSLQVHSGILPKTLSRVGFFPPFLIHRLHINLPFDATRSEILMPLIRQTNLMVHFVTTITVDIACRSLSSNLYLVKIKESANMNSLFDFVMIPDCLRVNSRKNKSLRLQFFIQISVWIEDISHLHIGAPIIFGWCPSLSAHESESILRTCLVCREKRDRERVTSKRHPGKSTLTN
jgi:hypothetical protein